MGIRKILPVILLFAASIYASGQTGYFQTKTVRKGENFTFPIFAHGANRKAETRINGLLQLSELHRLVVRPTKDVFEQAAIDDGTIYGGKVWMKATIYSNNHGILSLGFDESSCGMTCTYWHRYYNFNPGNGDRIELKDLFTPEGYEQFSKNVGERRSLKYRREVRTKVSPEYQEAYLDTVGCFENDDLTEFYIQNRTVVIDGENCLIKGQKFDGLDMYVRFNLAEFRRDLNAYGRTVFGLSNSKIGEFRSKELPQLFEGSIGGSLPIAMVLNEEFQNGIRGVYAYLNYGEGIGLDGNSTENGLRLTEYVLSKTVEDRPWGRQQKYVENGFFSATLNEGLLEGTWTSMDRMHTLPVVASMR
jgi:hypothetical protein